MVKAHLTEAADGRTLVVRYRMGFHSELSGVATFEDAVVKMVLSDSGGENVEVELIKLRPSMRTTNDAVSDADGNAPSDSVVRGSGTAFVVDPSGLLLTANHVIEDAKRIEVSCSGQPGLTATVRTSSAITDLALLEVEGLEIDTHLAISQSVPTLGEQVFTVGYPFVDFLGGEPKYTEGTISASSGPGGDASFLQISVPVQPGNSGGPLVNADGDVVGVVVATASAPAFFQASGTIPQNINWAVKGIFAAALFEPPPAPQNSGQASVIDRVREATCLVSTER